MLSRILKMKGLILVLSLSLLLVAFLASMFLGPGIGDYSEMLQNGYVYSDAGHIEKTIVYMGDEVSRQIVVDARVDEYSVEDSLIYVARRPRLVTTENGIPDSRLAADCEYWIIDSSTHQIRIVEELQEVNCR